MPMKDRIHLAVVEFNSSGGLIHYAYQLCSALAEQHMDVTLITGSDYELKEFPHNFKVLSILKLWSVFDPASMKATTDNPLHRGWIKIKWLFRRGTRAMKLLREWIRLTDYLIRLKPDLVQFGEIKFPFEAIFLARLQNRGLILSQICHEFERRERQSGFFSLTDRIYAGIFKNFSAIFFHAHQNRDRFLSLYYYPAEKIHMIPMGNERMFLTAAAGLKQHENLRQKYGLQDDEQVVLFFGMLTPSKGVQDLIKAFKVVRRQTRAKLVVAGYPSKYVNVNELKKLAADHKISDDVIFDTRYIPIQTIKPLMDLATVVVFPYHNATQSGALQVAYAFGRPVVATAVGGLPEVVEDGETGYLVPPREPEKMAEKIITILDTPSLSEKMGENAQRLSETRYGWTLIASQIAAVYHNLVAHSQAQ